MARRDAMDIWYKRFKECPFAKLRRVESILYSFGSGCFILSKASGTILD